LGVNPARNTEWGRVFFLGLGLRGGHGDPRALPSFWKVARLFLQETAPAGVVARIAVVLCRVHFVGLMQTSCDEGPPAGPVCCRVRAVAWKVNI
jgi:hypothetical protein